MEAADLWGFSDAELIALIARLDRGGHDRDALLAFSDDELIALIATLDRGGHDRGALIAGLNELFRRLRAEAAPSERSSVEAAVAHLRRTFSQADDDDGPELGGVREPPSTAARRRRGRRSRGVLTAADRPARLLLTGLVVCDVPAEPGCLPDRLSGGFHGARRLAVRR